MSLLHRHASMKDPVHSAAIVAQVPNWDWSWQRGYHKIEMELVVQGDGIPRHTVQYGGDMIDAGHWPGRGDSLPITIDRADQANLKVEWDEVETAAQRQQGLLAAKDDELAWRALLGQPL
jgi:hypothetical protein